MAENTSLTFLMKGSGTGTLTWTKLVDIKSYPDNKQARPTLDATTLSDTAKKYIFDIDDPGSSGMDFTCNYDATNYATILAMEGTETDLAIWLGGTVSDGVATPTGSSGKFVGKGYVTVRLSGGQVSAVREMIVNVAPTKIFEKASS